MPTRLGPHWDDAMERFLDVGEHPLEAMTLLPTPRGGGDVPGRSLNAVLTTDRVCFFTGLLKPKELHWWFPLALLDRIDTDTGWARFGLEVSKATTVTFWLTDGERFTGRVAGLGSRKLVARFVEHAYQQRRAAS